MPRGEGGYLKERREGRVLWSYSPLLREVGPHVVAVLTVLISVLASGHAVLRKRDVRAAVAWVGLVWLVPVVGAVLYLLLGINRIRRRARSLTLRQEHGRFPPNPTWCR